MNDFLIDFREKRIENGSEQRRFVGIGYGRDRTCVETRGIDRELNQCDGNAIEADPRGAEAMRWELGRYGDESNRTHQMRSGEELIICENRRSDGSRCGKEKTELTRVEAK